MYTETVKQTVMRAKSALTNVGVETDTALKVAMLALREGACSIEVHYALLEVRRSINSIYIAGDESEMLQEALESFADAVWHAADILENE